MAARYKYNMIDQESKNEELVEMSSRAYQFLREKMIEEAQEEFLRILEADEHNNYALVGLGDLERQRGDYHRAITYYQHCLEHHPENNYALFGLAESYRGLRQYGRAVEVWEQYLKHDSENVTVLTRVADAYRKIRSFERSRELYNMVLAIEDDNNYALIGMGHLHYDFKDYPNAMHYWQRMYEKSGESVDIRVLTSLGNCHRKMKTFDQGVEYFEAALQREPDNFFALYGMADCYRGMQEPAKSLIYWQRILANDPENKVILTRIGDAYRALGDLAAAEEHYRRALNVQFDTYAALGLAILHRTRKDYPAAVSALEYLIQAEPENYRAVAELAGCYEIQGKYAEALAVLARYMQSSRIPVKAAQRYASDLKARM